MTPSEPRVDLCCVASERSSPLLQVCSPDGCEAQVAQAGIEGTKSKVNLESWGCSFTGYWWYW